MTRAVIENAVRAIHLLRQRETELSKELARVRDGIAVAEDAVAGVVAEAEARGTTTPRWRQLLDGHEREVAMACAQSSLRHGEEKTAIRRRVRLDMDFSALSSLLGEFLADTIRDGAPETERGDILARRLARHAACPEHVREALAKGEEE